MAHLDTSFIYDLKKDSVSKIEYFVDFICDQLLINETYSGNILVSVIEFFNIAKEVSNKGKLHILYSTDYQYIKIKIKPIDAQLYTILKDKIKLDDIETSPLNKSLFLMNSLVDNVEFIENNSISFTFDISAVYNKVYTQRQISLNSYFEPVKVKLPKSNDSV